VKNRLLKNRLSRYTVASELFIGVTLVVLLSWGSSAFAQNGTIFGPNVYVFSPGSDAATQNVLNSSAVSGISQFGTGHVAIFFMPGTYNLQAGIGYNEAVYGLGMNPNSVVINGYITPNYGPTVSKNMTTTFGARCRTSPSIPAITNRRTTPRIRFNGAFPKAHPCGGYR